MSSSVRASIDLRPILRIMNPMFVVITAIVYVVQLPDTASHLQFHMGLLGMVGLMCIIGCTSILTYGKRDIIKITQPQGGFRGLLKSARVVFTHTIDLIIIPSLAILVIIHILAGGAAEVSLITVGSMTFVIMSLVQISPLRVRKEVFIRECNKVISEEIDTITASRCMRQAMDRRSREYKHWVDRQVVAEERMRVNSDFLTFSSGFRVMLTSLARFIMPVVGTMGPIIVRMVLGI